MLAQLADPHGDRPRLIHGLDPDGRDAQILADVGRRRQVDPECRPRALDKTLQPLLKPVGVTGEGISQGGGELSLDLPGPSRSCPVQGRLPLRRPIPRGAPAASCPGAPGRGAR